MASNGEPLRLTVKWGKETLELNPFSPAVGVKGLKAELEERTSVPADRQKIMAKSKGLWKGVLKDDTDMAALDWMTAQKKAGSTGLTVLLMGSAATLTGPKTQTVFLEDLPPEKIAQVVEPAGLVNMGNTCYMNSVVQCLRAIPTLRQGLLTYEPPSDADTNAAAASAAAASLGVTGRPSMALAIRRQFLHAMRDTLNSLDTQASAYQPTSLLQATHLQFPNFAARHPQTGHPMQQDAEEFLNGAMQVLATEMSGWDNIRKAFTAAREGSASGGSTGVTQAELLGAENIVDALFGLKVKEVLTCDEFDNSEQKDKAKGDEMQVDSHQDTLTEPPVVSYDLHRKLVCNIQGGSDASATTNVSHIAEGIRLSLQDKIVKHSDVLGRNAVWTRTQRIARLPPIICVQFGRFFWKATPDSADHAGVKCKVMKPVAFTTTLDLYEFCTDEVQKVLKVARDKARIAAEKELEARQAMKAEDKTEDGDDKKPTAASAESMQVEEKANDGDEDEDATALKEALAMSMQEDLAPVGPGLPNDFQGLYELFGVVTHKGRDADGGHYMAWVKAPSLPADSKRKAQKIADTDEENEDWFVYDDDEVSPCKTEDVLKLKGGGDWHMSYLNFYRAKK